ncbi:MAG: hypothetical protein WCI91_02435 [Candidatus Nomurabacteria bacterium]
MRNDVINVYKKAGQTPLDCINILKNDNPDLRFTPMTYAGRLDPLAEGVLLILTGDECLKKDEYLSLQKEYEVDILFGFKTDTYDVMGMITKPKEFFNKVIPSENMLFERSSDEGNWGRCQTIPNSTSGYVCEMQKIIPEFIGRIRQSYPPYSSRTVNGKPLFVWAREGKLGEIEIPSHDVFVESIDILDKNIISGEKLLKDIKEKISQVEGDFRQKEIISIWSDELKNKSEEEFSIIKLRISCGGGVYVRGIANEIGEKLGIGALALKIVRTKVGDFGIN